MTGLNLKKNQWVIFGKKHFFDFKNFKIFFDSLEKHIFQGFEKR